MSRLRGLIVLIGGLVLIVMGFGMYQSPYLDWEGFLAGWSYIINDIVRLTKDPFAVIGVVVLIVGLFMAFNGFKRLVRRH